MKDNGSGSSSWVVPDGAEHVVTLQIEARPSSIRHPRTDAQSRDVLQLGDDLSRGRTVPLRDGSLTMHFSPRARQRVPPKRRSCRPSRPTWDDLEGTCPR